MDGSMVLETVLAPRCLVLYVFAATALFVHFRGGRRHSFLRQLTDQSTFMAPINCFMYAFSAVPIRPILDPGSLPGLAILRDNWQVFRDEGLALYHQGEVKASERYDDLGFNSFFRHGWKRFYLKWYDDTLPSAERLCPRSVAILKQVPGIKGAMFAMLESGGALNEHRDPYAGSLRYHLGLSTPNDDRCRIYVDGVAHSWRDGEGLLFDETYIHKALNETAQDRLILFCDVARPMRYRFAARVNDFIAWKILRETATRNGPEDRVGLFNRAFNYIYPVRLLGKALKSRNRPVYYTVKYALIVGLLALIFV
jgi:beta-hydroxylase